MDFANFKTAVNDRKNYPDKDFFKLVLLAAKQSGQWQDESKREEALAYLKKKRPAIFKAFTACEERVAKLANARSRKSFS